MQQQKKLDMHLGVNIDHVATLRNARNLSYPSVVKSAQIVEKSNAHGVTMHLREDRRHICDEDVYAVKKAINIPLNLEMAATDEMLEIALNLKPASVCLVPENRQELTTEGGLDVRSHKERLILFVQKLQSSHIDVSIFVEPDNLQIQTCRDIGANIIEIHTGKYCNLTGQIAKDEAQKILDTAKFAYNIGLECHIGHGLTHDNVQPLLSSKYITSANIGHSIISEAIFIGLEASILKMLKIFQEHTNS